MGQSELYVSLMIITTGFVASGVLGSFYQLVSDRPIAFSVEAKSIFGSFLVVLVSIFAGPFIIMRNTIRGRRIEHRPVGWVVAASAIATLWSFCTGIIILQFVFSVSASLVGIA